MGNIVCNRPQPVEIYQRPIRKKSETCPAFKSNITEDDKRKLALLIFAKKTLEAPTLTLENNGLYNRRKCCATEDLTEIKLN